jgi:[acyl-carrier-protein] S-malonyltransferase
MNTSLLFPGQGAQAVGMARDIAESDPDARAVFDRANEVLGMDLARICFEGPLDELTKSSHAQPAIFVASVACLRTFEKRQPGAAFAAAAGLSSGEWTALYQAGVLSFEDALRVLQARGRFMQQACEEQPGGMVSVIGLDLAALGKVCAGSGLEIANLNSPEQTVLSGPRAGIPAAERLAKEAGARKVIPLTVAGAFHSSLMRTAAARLGEFLASVALRPPSIPVVSNVTGQPHGDPESIRRRMVEQVTSSVQWVEGIRWMQHNGIACHLECGPGRVLSGLVKRIDKQATLLNIQDLQSLESALAGWSA